MNLTVQEVAEVLKAEVYGSGNRLIKHVSIDTRTLNPGDFFWALKGSNFDGHDFAVEAFGKGASGALVLSTWDGITALTTFGRTIIAVDDTSQALKKLSSWWRSRFDIPVIAITGSLGKTTTKDWSEQILATNHQVFKTPGNRNNLIGLPLALLDLEPSYKFAVVEMGANHEGEIAELCRIANPTHGLITCVAPVHLEGYGNLDGVIRAKGELYDYLRPKGKVFLPIRDSMLRKLAGDIRAIGFGSGDPPQDLELERCFRIDIAGYSPQGQPILRIEGKTVTLKVIGDLWIPAASAAAAIGLYFNVPVDDVISCLSELEAGPGRLKSFATQGMEIWDDTYNSNPESLKAALNVLVSRPAKRHIAVIGDMLELGTGEEELHRNVGVFIKNLSLDAVFTYGHRAAWIAETQDVNSKLTVESFHDQESMVKRLQEFLKPGDVVLFKASRSMFLERILCQLLPEIADYYENLKH